MQIKVKHLSKHFGGLKALSDVSLIAQGGEVTAVIGPNGSGKSTLLNCISGVIPIDAGSITIDGSPMPKNPLDNLVDLGITRTFQNIRLFESLSTLEHLVLPRYAFRHSARGASNIASSPEAECSEILKQVGLENRAWMKPSELSYGERRRLEIARGLAIEPRLLLLDEPAAGSTQSEQLALATLIADVAARGTAVILVEHHMNLVSRVANKVVVLNFGQILMTGTMDEVRRNPDVISAYLGKAAA
jgi:ABC-type branched-subunit amino acid transport system ATPase component